MSAAPHALRLALIGAGGIAGAYVDALETTSNVEAVAVADVRVEAAERLARRLGCVAVPSFKEVSPLDVDAVVVCTPPVTHPEIALHFLHQRVAVLCEKPLAIDSGSATEMLEAAQRDGAVLTMASKFRYVDDVVQARDLLRSGVIGDVILFETAFTSKVDMSQRWNSDPRISGGGVLIDNGPHSVDIVRYFLGPVAQVMAVEGKRAQGLMVEDTVQVFIRSADGVVGTIDLSWSIDKSLEHYVQIFGTKGEIRVGWRRSSVRCEGDGDWLPFGTGYHKLDAIGSQLREFCGAVRGDSRSVMTAEDALASVRVIEAAYRSLNSDHWVPVDAAPAGTVDLSVAS